MVHEEAPHQLTQAFHLFLQGMGYSKWFDFIVRDSKNLFWNLEIKKAIRLISTRNF